MSIFLSRFSFVACALFAGSLVVLSPAIASASPAADTVKSTVEKVQAEVVKSEGKVSPEQLEHSLREIIAPVFDFREMSRRSLGANWKKANPEQQEQFVDLFSDLLARNYLKKIRENVAKSGFTLAGEMAKGAKSLVQTTVDYEGKSASIDYRMREKGGSWMIYDVVIENVGLVSNYRSEFAGIVKKDGIEGLIKLLREKN
jgi:phospholipid transport system substrate-binding protein